MGDEAITVCVRVRPSSAEEEGRRACLRAMEPDNAIVLEGTPAKVFSFDYVAGPNASQEEMFEKVGKTATEACFAGYNATVFAYGQTGSGKTHTMMGATDENGAEIFDRRGIAPRALQYLFGLISSDQHEPGPRPTFMCRCTMLEIYNETICDLLNPSAQHLQIREDFQRGVFVEGLFEETVASWEEAYGILKRGTRQRTTGETLMNAKSSRSHCVFTVDVQSKKIEPSGLVSVKYSRLNLVDLAGSERQKMTSAVGMRLKEAGQINKSLSNLSSVISSLVDKAAGKERHVHFRDSKLTFLLKESLGGNSKCTVIANVSPVESSYGETLSTLMFAQRAKLIKNRVVVNEQVAGNTQQLQAELRRVKDELEALRAQGVNPAEVQQAQGCPLLSPVNASAVGDIDEEWDVEKTRLELMLLRMQDRNLEVSRDKDSLMERVSLLQEAISKSEQTILQLRFVLKLKESKLARTHANGEVESLRRQNEELIHSTCDYSAFQRLIYDWYVLKDEKEKRDMEPTDAAEWQNKLEEANAHIADLEEKCKELLSRVHVTKINFDEAASEMPSMVSKVEETVTVPMEFEPKTPLRSKPVESIRQQEIFIGTPSRRFQPSAATVELQAELQKMKTKNGELSLAVDAANERLERAEMELANAREALEQAEAETAMQKNIAETSYLKSAAMQKRLQSDDVTIAELKQRLEESEMEIATLRERLMASGSATTQESERLRFERDSAMKAKAEADTKLADAMKEIAILKEQKAAAEEQRRAAMEEAAVREEYWARERAEAQRIENDRRRALAAVEEEVRALASNKQELTAELVIAQGELLRSKARQQDVETAGTADAMMAMPVSKEDVESILAEVEAMDTH